MNCKGSKKTSKVTYKDKEELNDMIKEFPWGTRIPPERLREVLRDTKKRAKVYEVITIDKMKKYISRERLLAYNTQRRVLRQQQLDMAAALEEETKKQAQEVKQEIDLEALVEVLLQEIAVLKAQLELSRRGHMALADSMLTH